MTGFDAKEVNAFDFNRGNFVVDQETSAIDNIVAVSYGLIQKCETEDEFAAILAHECGHVIWNLVVPNQENSIFQEQSNDINAVVWLHNAGYNPRYELLVMQRELKHNKITDIVLDVHGNDYHRIENIKARLAQLDREYGRIPDVDNQDPEWQKWKQDVANVYAKEGFETYIDRQFHQQFGTKDLNSVNREKVLEFVLQLFDKLYVTHVNARRNSLMEYLSKMSFANKNEYETKLTQDLFIRIANLTKDRLFTMDPAKNDNIVIQVLRNFELEKFGAFEQCFNYIDGFIKSVYDKEQLKVYMHNIMETQGIFDDARFLRCFNGHEKYGWFGYPELKGLKADNIGKMLPWRQLESYKETKSNNNRDKLKYDGRMAKFGSLRFGKSPQEAENHDEMKDLDKIFEKLYYRRLSPYDDAEETQYKTIQDYVAADNVAIHYYEEKDEETENFIVKKYGDEAIKLNLEQEIGRDSENFDNVLKIFNSLAEYDQGKIDYKEFFSRCFPGFLEDDSIAGSSFHSMNKYFMQGGYVFGFFQDVLFGTYNGDIERKKRYREGYEFFIKKYNLDFARLRNFYNIILNSEFYNHFLKNSPEMKYFDALPKNVWGMMVKCYSFIRPGAFGKDFFEKIEQIYIKILNDLFKGGFSQQIEMFYGFAMDPNPDKFFVEKEEDISIARKKDGEMSQIVRKNVLGNIGEFQLRNFVDEYFKKLNKHEEYFFDTRNFFYVDYALSKYLDSDEYGEEDILKFLRYFGIDKIPTNNDELMDAQNKITEQDVNTVLKDFCRYAVVGQYLKSGHKINFYNLMMGLTSANANDIFGKYFGTKEFKSFENIKEKISVYEKMQDLKIFSDKYANKNAFMKIIVKQIISKDYEKFDTMPEYVEYAEKLLSGRAVGYGKDNKGDIEFVNEREKLCDYYANYWVKKLGRDDGTLEYNNKVKDVINKIETQSGFSDTIKENVFEKISSGVVSQKQVAEMLSKKGKAQFDGTEAERYNNYGIGIEGIFNAAANDKMCSYATIKFLTSKLSEKTIQDYIKIIKVKDSHINFTPEFLTTWHENFWNASIELRAVIMSRFLDAYSLQNKDEKLNFVIESFFEPGSKYYKDAKNIIESVYNNYEEYNRDIVLASLLSANQQSENNTGFDDEQVGRGLKMFFQASGGAFIKFGQLLSYLPDLPKGIREELATLRDKADIPTRDKIYKMIEKALPKEKREKISYVGEILGAGSLYVTVRVVYDNKPCVLGLMRKNTQVKIPQGIDLIERVVKDIASKDSKFAPLTGVVERAKQSCESEINIDKDYEKYKNALEMYSPYSIKIGNKKWTPNVAKWVDYGSRDNGDYAWKIMEEAPGKALTSLKMNEQDKHDNAKAYVALELCVLLSGNAWDTDRHQGQQNFEENILNNKNFRDFMIGIFDTGAQMNKAPSMKDRQKLGQLFADIIYNSMENNSLDFATKFASVMSMVNPNMPIVFDENKPKNKEFANVLNDAVSKLAKDGDNAYIEDVRRGLIALSDIIEYQKPYKDKDDNFCSGKALSREDLADIFVVVKDFMDNDVKSSFGKNIVKKAIFDLRFDLLGKFGNKSNIVIEKNNENAEVQRLEKSLMSLEEAQNVESQEQDKMLFGVIDKDRLKTIQNGNQISELSKATLFIKGMKRMLEQGKNKDITSVAGFGLENR